MISRSNLSSAIMVIIPKARKSNIEKGYIFMMGLNMWISFNLRFCVLRRESNVTKILTSGRCGETMSFKARMGNQYIISTNVL